MYHGLLVDVRGQLVELDLATFVWILGNDPMSLGFEVSIFYYSILFHCPIGTNFLCCFSVFLRKISLLFFSPSFFPLPPPFSLFFPLFSSLCLCLHLSLLIHVNMQMYIPMLMSVEAMTPHVFLYFSTSYCLEIDSHLSWTPGAVITGVCSQSGFFLSAGI